MLSLTKDMQTKHELIRVKKEEGLSKEREEIEGSEKNKPCLTIMMTPPLASVTSVEKIPDPEWVPSDRRAENPGIRKEGDEVRLDSWIQIRSTG